MLNLQGYEIRDFGNQLLRHWRLGDEARNDGVLLLVAATDRKMSIEVGYGLEGTLTDAIAKIIEYSIAPAFRRAASPAASPRVSTRSRGC